MKYMGSKRYMLANGLGELLHKHVPKAKRFIDLFSGSGGVVNYVAVQQKFKGEIIAGDLQKYSMVLAKAVIGRTNAIDPTELKVSWIDVAKSALYKTKLLKDAEEIEHKYANNIRLRVKKARDLCNRKSSLGPVWNAYGGHYYSPKQALAIDHLLNALPARGAARDVCHAALIIAASRAAAAPGHTAQPFQPTPGASKFIEISWRIDIFRSCETALKELADKHAFRKKGMAVVSDAKKLVSILRPGDLVFLDPPYSGVQYSRFYHVLETIARGRAGEVTGVGRYPSLKERPQSAFSNSGQSLKALDQLLSALAEKKVKVIFTFPIGKCSNGLSGDDVALTAEKYFDLNLDESRIHTHAITGTFSTLGGNNKVNKEGQKTKRARVESEELVLLLEPQARKEQ